MAIFRGKEKAYDIWASELALAMNSIHKADVSSESATDPDSEREPGAP